MAYFGLCPQCKDDSPYLNVHKEQFKVCTPCGVFWPIGRGLFSSWQQETEEDWQRNRELLDGLTQVEPAWPTPEECAAIMAAPQPCTSPPARCDDDPDGLPF